MPFTISIRHKIVQGITIFLKCFVNSLLLMLVVRVEDVAEHLVN